MPARRTAALLTTGGLALTLLLLALGAPAASAAGPPAPVLGTAAEYAVLAGTSVANTGVTTLDGSLGVSPGNQVSGDPVVVTAGTVEGATTAAAEAQTALSSAFDAAGGATSTRTVTTLATEVLSPGVYTSAEDMGLTGALTLSGEADDVFVFQVGAHLTAAAGSSVVLDGVRPCNVFWQVAENAQLGSVFMGTVMAGNDIELLTGAALTGRALAAGGVVTLDTNVVTSPGTCRAAATASPTATATATPTPTATATATPTAAAAASTTPAMTTTLVSDPTVPAGNPSTGEGGAASGSLGSLLLVGGLALGWAAFASVCAVRRPHVSRHSHQ